MKRIDVSTPKHPNTFALVDDEDYDRLMVGPKWGAWQSKRTATIYAIRVVYINRKQFKQQMHRFVLSAQTGTEVDHANLNGLDNQKSNLRFASAAQNQWNRKALKNNTSGYKGVHWNVRDKRWCARIRQNGIRMHLGYFKTAIEASEAYKIAAHQLHGKFARCA